MSDQQLDVPVTWAWSPLDELLTVVEAGSRPKGGVREIREGIPSVGGEHLTGDGRIRTHNMRFVPSEFAAGITQGWIERHDVLVVKDGATTGKVAFVDESFLPERALVNEHVLRLGAATGVDPKYIYYFLRSDSGRKGILSDFRGAAQGGISRSFARKVRVPLAPVAEQRRIVTKLDELLASSRAARAALDAVPELLERYRQAVLAAAFRGAQTDACAVEPDDLPKHWSWAAVDELAAPVPRAIQSGPFGSALKHEEFQESGVLAVGIDNVHRDGFRLGRQNRISEEKFGHLAKFAARPGDVLVTVMASVGRCCVMPDHVGPAIITKHVYRITVDERRVRPRYLMYALQGATAVLAQIGASLRGQTRPGINGEILRSLRIPLAPRSTQDVIIRRIEEVLAGIQSVASAVAAQAEQVAVLDSTTLSKAFRGELVPQDPADEPASPLLARLRAERASAPASRTRRVTVRA